MSERRFLPVPDALVGQRIDRAVARMLGMSRTEVQEMCEDGRIAVNGVTVGKSEKLAATDMIEVDMTPPDVDVAPVVGMDVLYSDEDVIVVNKPVGVAAHSGPGWDGPTVLAALEASGVRISTSGPPERQGIVHRLDVGTSGAMAVAKSELAYTKLKHAFKDRRVHKTYHAVVAGHPDPERGTVDAPIGRHPSKEWRMAVVAGGREAITHYRTLELLPAAALMELILDTGRTHQIRVHMSALGHPCVGDTFYGADAAQAERLGLTRQWLHAARLEFTHPRTGVAVRIEAPYPDDLNHALDVLRHPERRHGGTND